MQAGDIRGRFPTIPEYYNIFINKDVDLLVKPKQCCPFHYETIPSFSFSPEKNVWRCFGGCNCGGDVIELHRKNFRIRSRKKAEKSLKAIFHVYMRPVVSIGDLSMQVNKERVEMEALYQKACLMANRPSRWLELDYVMSFYPVEQSRLKELVERWSEERN